MSVVIAIRESSCRGCALCEDICPTRVLELDANTKVMKVTGASDCIACLSCAYICPSAAISHTGYPRVKDFCRDAGALERLERFL